MQTMQGKQEPVSTVLLFNEGDPPMNSLRLFSLGLFQQLTVARPGERYQALSIPFLKPSLARGRFDGVVVDEGGDTLLLDNDGFLDLSSYEFFSVRITSGPQRGRICGALVEYKTVNEVFRKVLRCYDGGGVDLATLDGSEAFSVHQVFYLSELFPSNGAVVPAGAVELEATRVLLFWNGKFLTYWLSDGTNTGGKRGWATGGQDGLVRVYDDVGLFPGDGFLIQVPEVTEPIVITVSGEVLLEPMVQPLRKGFNLVGTIHNLSRTNVSGEPSTKLIDSGLAESGFAAGAVDSLGGDRVRLYNPATNTFDVTLRLKEIAEDWAWEIEQETPSGANEVAIEPGAAISVFRESGPMLWEVGK